MLSFVVLRSHSPIQPATSFIARVGCVLLIALYIAASTLHVCDRGLGEALGTPCTAGARCEYAMAAADSTAALPATKSTRPSTASAVHCPRCKPQPPHCALCPAVAISEDQPTSQGKVTPAGMAFVTANEKCQSCPYCLAAMLEGMGAQKANMFRFTVARSVSYVAPAVTPSLVSLSPFRRCDARAPPAPLRWL